MRRRGFLRVGLAATLPATAHAREVGQPFRVAYLGVADDQDAAIVRERLGELGYGEGRSLVFEVRSAGGDLARLSALAAEIVRSAPDAIVAGVGTAAPKAAQGATAAIPIVFIGAGDPLGTGLVKSLSRPGGNVTGLNTQAGEINGKRLQLLDDLAPGTRRVAVLLSPDAPFTPSALADLKAVAAQRGTALELCPVRTADELAPRLEAAMKAGATALTILETPPLLEMRRPIAERAARLRLVAIYGSRAFVEAGGLMSYGADRRHLDRRAAELVDKILKGQAPADIPVEQPTVFELVLNQAAARALGIGVPPSLLAMASEVIE
jgi:putative ABC transport system substrate-binding protein